MKTYGGVRVIIKGAVNLVLINKFIQFHYHLQSHMGCSPYQQLYQPQHIVIPKYINSGITAQGSAVSVDENQIIEHINRYIGTAQYIINACK